MNDCHSHLSTFSELSSLRLRQLYCCFYRFFYVFIGSWSSLCASGHSHHQGHVYTQINIETTIKKSDHRHKATHSFLRTRTNGNIDENGNVLERDNIRERSNFRATHPASGARGIQNVDMEMEERRVKNFQNYKKAPENSDIRFEDSNQGEITKPSQMSWNVNTYASVKVLPISIRNSAFTKPLPSNTQNDCNCTNKNTAMLLQNQVPGTCDTFHGDACMCDMNINCQCDATNITCSTIYGEYFQSFTNLKLYSFIRLPVTGHLLTLIDDHFSVV